MFPPPLEDGVPIGMDDRHSRLGEDDLAAKVGKCSQAYEGMGEGGHHMTLHRCRRKRWGGCEGCAGNRPLREAVRNADAIGGSLMVKVGHGRTGREVKSTGARVGDASAGER